MDELTPAALGRVERARARIRRHVWARLPATPASKVAGTDLGKVGVLDVDATLVTAHSEKELARPTFKCGFGYYPLGVWCEDLDIRIVNAITGELIRELVLNPDIDYQPTGAPKGPTRRPRK